MQNFGKIKNVFNNLLVEGITKKDDSTKKLFKKYIKTIKESEILKTQFFVYNNIETKHENDPVLASLFVSENIKLLEKYGQKEILKENKKLVDLLNEYSSRLDENYDLSNLHESISNLIFTKRTPKTINVLTEEIKKVSEYIKKDKTKVTNESVDLPVSVLTKMMVEKYNERYSDLNETDKNVLKMLINATLTDKKKIYSNIVNECVELIDNLLVNESAPKEKLLSVKTKLLESTEITEENFIERISRVIDLKENLK